MFNLPRVLALFILLCASCVAQIAEPQQIVGKVHGHHFDVWQLRMGYGTGWCLDQRCTALLTAYHVARPIASHISFNDVKIQQVHFATGPNDDGARILPSRLSSAFSFTLAWVRDLSLLSPETPPAHMHGISLFPGQLQPNEKVHVYGYPGGHFSSVRGTFVREVEKGVLEFDLERPRSGSRLEGLSGGLVVNQFGQAVGLLFGDAISEQHSYAVPIWSIADFVRSVRPDLYPALFPQEVYRPTATDLTVSALYSYLQREKPGIEAVRLPVALYQRAAELFEMRELRSDPRPAPVFPVPASTRNLPAPPPPEETRMAGSVIGAFCQDAVVASTCAEGSSLRPAPGHESGVSRPLSTEQIASTYYLDLTHTHREAAPPAGAAPDVPHF